MNMGQLSLGGKPISQGLCLGMRPRPGSRGSFFYNTQRFPQALGNRTPMAVWREGVSDAPGGGLSEYPLPKAVIGALG